MAKLTEEMMHEILAPIAAGQDIAQAAYGIKQPNILYMLPFFALAIVPGVLMTQKLTKHYIVGLTSSHILVAEVAPKWSTLAVAVDSVKSAQAIALAGLRGKAVRGESGAIFTNIAFPHDSGQFTARFHRAFSRTNRPAAVAIGNAVVAAAG
ncbi:hypothetical protein [Abyssibius alkaniclasticus]|uniref:hypothetical protein n=1 Tax=Abyssibius alkaniclasticus TaxID=2881234 RepID=UPI0040587F5E